MSNSKWADFFGQEDWGLICRHGATIHDKDEKQAFWESCLAMKRAEPTWTFSSHLKEMAKPGVVPEVESGSEKGKMAKRYTQAILDDLAKKNFKRLDNA